MFFVVFVFLAQNCPLKMPESVHCRFKIFFDVSCVKTRASKTSRAPHYVIVLASNLTKSLHVVYRGDYYLIFWPFTPMWMCPFCVRIDEMFHFFILSEKTGFKSSFLLSRYGFFRFFGKIPKIESLRNYFKLPYLYNEER